jgi:hypothetical protein
MAYRIIILVNINEVNKKQKQLLRPGIELETMRHALPLWAHAVLKPIHECVNLTNCIARAKMVQIRHIVFPAHVTSSRV